MTDPATGWRGGLANDEIRQQALAGYLANRDWTAGIDREQLLIDLAATPVLAGVVERGLAPGVYFSAADVVAALPASAWASPAPSVAPVSDWPALTEHRGLVGGAALVALVAGLVALWRRARAS